MFKLVDIRDRTKEVCMYRKVFIGFLLIFLTVSYGRGIRGIIHEPDSGGRLVPNMLNYQGYLTDTE